MRTIFFLLVMTAAASAAEPTVTLTQSELTAIVSAEVSREMTGYMQKQAEGAYTKVKQAFPPPTPPTAPK